MFIHYCWCVKMKLRYPIALLFVLQSFICGKAFSASYLDVGDSLDLTALEDQNGNSFEDHSVMQGVLFVRGMETKDLVKETLAGLDPSCLSDGTLVYVADISKMPGFIAKMVAIPRMRDYGYPVWLDRDGTTTDAFPVREGLVTLLTVEDDRVADVIYSDDIELLSGHLLKFCQPVNRGSE